MLLNLIFIRCYFWINLISQTVAFCWFWKVLIIKFRSRNHCNHCNLTPDDVMMTSMQFFNITLPELETYQVSTQSNLGFVHNWHVKFAPLRRWRKLYKLRALWMGPLNGPYNTGRAGMGWTNFVYRSHGYWPRYGIQWGLTHVEV